MLVFGYVCARARAWCGGSLHASCTSARRAGRWRARLGPACRRLAPSRPPPGPGPAPPSTLPPASSEGSLVARGLQEVGVDDKHRVHVPRALAGRQQRRVVVQPQALGRGGVADAQRATGGLSRRFGGARRDTTCGRRAARLMWRGARCIRGARRGSVMRPPNAALGQSQAHRRPARPAAPCKAAAEHRGAAPPCGTTRWRSWAPWRCPRRSTPQAGTWLQASRAAHTRRARRDGGAAVAGAVCAAGYGRTSKATDGWRARHRSDRAEVVRHTDVPVDRQTNVR
jgi:hypothetical protein